MLCSGQSKVLGAMEIRAALASLLTLESLCIGDHTLGTGHGALVPGTGKIILAGLLGLVRRRGGALAI